jgi:single-strand DNA-binding protein
MAGSINKVILVGNVGSDPEIRSMNNGKEVASFSLATSESWKDKSSGERRDKTEWHSINVFNEGLINVIRNYIVKGSKLYIEGALQTRSWQDQASGQTKYKTEIVLQGFNGNITMLDSRREGGASAGGDFANSQKSNNTSSFGQTTGAFDAPQNGGNKDFVAEELDDEVPF